MAVQNRRMVLIVNVKRDTVPCTQRGNGGEEKNGAAPYAAHNPVTAPYGDCAEMARGIKEYESFLSDVYTDASCLYNRPMSESDKKEVGRRVREHELHMVDMYVNAAITACAHGCREGMNMYYGKAMAACGDDDYDIKANINYSMGDALFKIKDKKGAVSFFQKYIEYRGAAKSHCAANGNGTEWEPCALDILARLFVGDEYRAEESFYGAYIYYTAAANVMNENGGGRMPQPCWEWVCTAQHSAAQMLEKFAEMHYMADCDRKVKKAYAAAIKTYTKYAFLFALNRHTETAARMYDKAIEISDKINGKGSTDSIYVRRLKKDAVGF